MDLERFKKKPIMGILRGVDLSVWEPLLEVIISSGLETIEVTMNTSKAPELIQKAVKLAGKTLMIGAGTVLDIDSLKLALDAGATFIVSPVLVDEVVRYCVKNNIPVFPGALTVQEIYNAYKSGAAMVKVFPAKFFGPEYFKEVKAPLNNIKLLACAGVTPDNLKDYFMYGADAIAFGGNVFKKEWLEQKKFTEMAGFIKRYIMAMGNMKNLSYNSP